MNKKTILTCVLLVMLAFAATACKLPASGSPPIPTLEPTTTTVLVPPTNTSVPPTPVVVTETVPPTPLLPSPVPTTAVPPTAIPPTVQPTSAPLPQAVRIQFAAGGTSAVIDGDLEAGQTANYVLNASATQVMSVKVTSPNSDVYLGVFTAEQVFLSNIAHETIWSGTLPATNDYYLSLTAGGGTTSYTLTVDIPPLPNVPTANVTQVPGEFDPAATYGSPTFEDKMDGENINDWVNPVTGLLPDTNLIKIAETDEKFYVTGKLAGFSTWYFTWHELADFYLESTFNSGSCTGLDAYGMIVRGPQHLAGKSYGYVVEFSCDGQYYVFRVDSANPYTTKDLVTWSKSDYIVAGANKQNVMGIKAVGDTLTIYANGHQIADIFDNKYGFGRYGLFVAPELTANYTYRVVYMAYWDLEP